MTLGICLPNVAFRPYSDAELAALDDLKPSILCFLLYGGDIDLIHRAQLGPFLSRGHAMPKILYRPYAGNIPTWTPHAWAKECQHRIRDVGLVGELVPANEFNLEGFGTDWAKQIEWLTAFVKIWRQLEPTIPIHLPALSPTNGYEYGLMAYVQAGLPALYDVMDFHCYTTQDLATASTTAQAISKPSMITEYNQVNSEEVVTYGKDAVYFLLGGTPDQSPFDILKDPVVYGSFKKVSTGAQPLTNTYTSGFDISNNNGNVDWSITGILDGYGFVSIKASEGADFKDSYFASDWDNAAKAGLVRQAYHFGRPSESSGSAEAKAFLSVVQSKLQKGDSVCLDLEDTRVGATADLHAYALDFLKTCEDALGFRPMFYSGRWYTGPHHLEGHADLAQYGLWIASWAPTAPNIKGMGWDFWAAWQYGAGPLPGITGVVDFDVFNGPIEQLKKYGKP